MTVDLPDHSSPHPSAPAPGDAHNTAGNGANQMIDKALGHDGPVDNRRGTWLDPSAKQETNDVVLSTQTDFKPWLAKVPVTDSSHASASSPSASDRSTPTSTESVPPPLPEKTNPQPESEPSHDIDTQPSKRGPSWASRPNDEQREWIKKLKAQQASGGWSRSISYQHSPDKSRDHSKPGSPGSPEGSRFGGFFDTTSSGQRSPINPLNLSLNLKKRSTSVSAVATRSNDRPASRNRSQSQWAENSNPLRSALEPDYPSEQEETDNAGPEAPFHDSPMQESPNPAQLTPTHQKMRAITKLMLRGKSDDDHPGINPDRGNSTSTTSSTANANNDTSQDRSKDSKMSKNEPGQSGTPQNRWNQLKKMVRESARAKKEEAKNRAVGTDLNYELQTGILPVLLLKMAIERDEQKHRRIPVLLNQLRLRVTDSVNLLNTTHAVFRIELEYGDGLIKWVVYRELRDFINLHAHYRAAALRGYLGRSIGNAEGDVGLPSFPKMSLPYLNQLQRQGRYSKADLAKAQRDALENYIIELIRRTMFRPEANRLCKFFEISALSVSLASRGGQQGKQGYLRILSKSSRKKAQKGMLTPARLAKAYEPKWFIVRESFIVIVNEPDTLQIYDVFLMDNDFKIERPKRFYKQTMHIAHGLTHSDEKPEAKAAESSNQTNGAASESREDHTALLTDGQFVDPEKKKAQRRGKTSKSDPNRHTSSHTFYIRNAERKLKLVAKTERQMDQFIASMQKMADRNIFGAQNRFDSFAPIRLNASAQWMIDGRDYFWNLSKALMMAKDRIFIHDWWLSPEVYLRRPGQPKWRLDNILKKKAQEGVKIFVIIYNEVSNNFTPTDSNYTKQRLIHLHPNIYVQRSPSHFQTGTFYWAHHEKLCVIDETIAFMGGLDMCYGRWDTPAHVLVDDAYYESGEGNDPNVQPSHPHLLGPARDGKEAHVWPGQDYANERVMEWHTLSKPHEDLFARDKFPRMPWHDVGLQLVGQPARDLCRHFAQRWNFLLRIKNHTRMMPFLVPPPDFTPEELNKYGLTGSCEVQICRSAGPWSLGTSSKVEHSIQNAYLKSIQMSEHFVYIENQFFVTSTVVEGNTIENQIGEALVSRIIRAHREGTPWRAIIIIPLIPGFPMPIDHPDASSVRLIVELQNKSIARGEHSIFGKLRREGINPEDYISFFSLRTWGKLRGGQLTTEQIYPHDKIMIVDDRLVIIGSANINERSQRGDRDSELACVIRDYDMIDSTMAGMPYKVGRFAHRLRVQLMREHLGVDVDGLEAEERRREEASASSCHGDEDRRPSWTDGDSHSEAVSMESSSHHEEEAEYVPSREGKGKAKDKPLADTNGERHHGQLFNEGSAHGHSVHHTDTGAEPSQEEKFMIKEKSAASLRPLNRSANGSSAEMMRKSASAISLTDSAGHGHSHGHGGGGRQRGRFISDAGSSLFGNDEARSKFSTRSGVNSTWQHTEAPEIDPYKFEDPVADSFYEGYWLACAVHNTQIYRKVFKCVPDDTVTTWGQYKAFQAWADRLARSGKFGAKESREQREGQAHSVPGASVGGPDGVAVPPSLLQRSTEGAEDDPGSKANGAPMDNPASKAPAPAPTPAKGFSNLELEQMEALLEETQGALVIHPTKFLEAEDMSNNFLFAMDRINPLLIYD